MSLRLAVVDDEPLWVDLLSVALTRAGHVVEGTFTSASEALRRWPPQTQVGLIDVELGRGSMNGFQLGRRLRVRDEGLRLVFLSSVVDPWMIDAAAASAIAGTSYLLKRKVSNVAQLDAVLRTTAAGGIVVDDQVMQAIHGQEPVSGLSPQQVRILRLVATGWSNAQIAQELALSVKAVEANITRIARAFGVDQARNVRVACVTRYLAMAVNGPHEALARE